jgi:hypothetical protein
LTDLKTPVFFGNRIGGGGDIDADGVPNVLVGDYYSSAAVHDGGAVWAFSGKTGAVLYEFDSTVKKSYFGFCSTIPGDVNADGFADILIGAPQDGHLWPYGGSATVYSGKDGSVLLSYDAPPGGSMTSLGEQVGGAGDVNEDGFADFFVTCPALSEAFLYSGCDGGLIYHFQDVTNPIGADGFPRAIARAGDLGADGTPDFVFTATAEDQGSIQDTGSVSAWRGHAFFADTTPRLAYAYSNVTATIGQDIAGNPYALFLLDFNGTPSFAFSALESSTRRVARS